MRYLFVVAHAQSLHHVEGTVGGGYDTSLTELGERQAEAVGRTIASHPAIAASAGRRAVWSSDLKRASETASIVSRHLGVEVARVPELRELGCGVAEGRPKEWLSARYRPHPEDEVARLDHRICEGAETRREGMARIYPAVEAIAESATDVGVCVTHGGALTYVLAAWLGIPAVRMGAVRFRTRPGAITELEIDPSGDRTLTTLSSTAHLDAI